MLHIRQNTVSLGLSRQFFLILVIKYIHQNIIKAKKTENVESVKNSKNAKNVKKPKLPKFQKNAQNTEKSRVPRL